MSIFSAFRRRPAARTAPKARAGYEIVSPPYSANRRGFSVEQKGEDEILPTSGRNRLAAAGRDMMRNSPTRVAMDQQRRVNVVGTVGGKLYASFPEGYADAASAVMRYFNRVWAPRCEFTYGKNFNWLLKTVLTAEDVGGNVVLVFDDGVLTGGDGSGRIRGFEADEIANVSDADFAALFPAGYTQRGGFVYDNFGRFAGCFVSTTQRGADVFERGKFLTLRADQPNWTVLGPMLRFNQGRAVAPLSSALATAVDLHEILSSETLAAKFNAQLVGQIIRSVSDGEDQQYNPYSVTAAEGAAEDPDAERVKKITLDHLRACGIRYQDMPEGVKMELLDTKRPNANMPAFVDFLTGLIGGTRGLARVCSTLKAQTSYTAFRGEQVMTWPSFEEAQKDLERDVCDWAARLAVARAVRRGEIAAALPDEWEYMLAWQWPKMREVSEKDAQGALALKLQNGTTSLKRELGPGEVERIVAERKLEKALFDDAGLIYPGTTTVSGEIVGGTEENQETQEETPPNE
jgi:capsid protein